MKLVPGDCGIQYLQSIVNVLSAIQTFVLSYGIVFPKKRQKAVSKYSGQTNYIEIFNNTMRQRISRLVRKTLSFSKKLSNHIGAIWYFIHEYNASLSIKQKAWLSLLCMTTQKCLGLGLKYSEVNWRRATQIAIDIENDLEHKDWLKLFDSTLGKYGIGNNKYKDKLTDVLPLPSYSNPKWLVNTTHTYSFSESQIFDD